ncbi:hypothetical protein K7Y63_004147 [Serratia marcescens]
MQTVIEKIQNTSSIKALVEVIRNALRNGRKSYVVTAKGEEVKTQFEVIDASMLLVSNHLDGRINEAYPQELQPRDRTRFSSKLQVNNISRSLRPAQLTDSGLSSHGAPIIGEDNAVESGNGRSMGIIRAYAEGRADDYRSFLMKHAREYGVRARDIEQMERPILVRRRLTEVDRVKFAKDSNLSDLQEMSASEKAFVDAESITPAMMQLFAPSDSGDLLSRSNVAFVQAFMDEIGATAAAGLLTEDGRPTRQLIDRMQNSIFAKAYKDIRLVKMVSEEPDPEMRNVLTALNSAASDFAQMVMLSGDVHRETVGSLVESAGEVYSLDKTALGALKDAIDLVRRSKESGQHINDVIAQVGMFEEATGEAKALALFIVENNRSAKRMGQAFKLMAERINDELIHQQQAMGDMFGGGSVSLEDVLQMVSNQMQLEGGKGLTGALFESSKKRDDAVLPVLRNASSIQGMKRIIEALTFDGSGSLSTLAAAVNAAIKTLTKTNINDAAALKRYQALTASILGKKIETFTDRYGRTSLYTLHPLIRNAHMFKQPDWSALFNSGQIFQLHNAIKLVMKEEAEREVIIAAAREAYPVISKVIGRSRTLTQGYMSAMGIMLPEYRPAVAYKAIVSASGDKGKSTLSATGASVAVMYDMDRGREMMRGGNVTSEAEGAKERYAGHVSRINTRIKSLQESDQEVVSTLPYSLRAAFPAFASVDLSGPRLSFGQTYGARKSVSNWLERYAPDEIRSLAEKHKERSQLVWEIINEMADAAENHQRAVVGLCDRARALAQEMISESVITEREANEWVRGIKINKKAISTIDGKHGEGAFLNALSEVYRLCRGGISTLKEIKYLERTRAAACVNDGSLVLGASADLGVLWHELGHHFEYSHPDRLAKAKAFMSTGGDAGLMDLGGKEIAANLNFSDPYIGRLYASRTIDGTRSTEIFSMAFQCLHEPRYAGNSILNGDAILDFVLGLIKGEHNA